MAIEFLHDIEGQSARFRKSASDQQSNADSASVPSTTQPEVIRIEGGYTNGQYTTEIVKLDRGGNLPLYIRQSGSSANTFSNIMRIGHHSGSTHQLEVFGTAKATHFYGDGSNLTGVTATPTAHNHDDRYYTETEMKTFFKRGYIEAQSETNLAVGWYTIAINTGDRALGTFQIWDTASSDHQSVIFNASHHFGTDTSNSINILANSRFSGTNFRYIRIKEAGTYDGAALQVYIDAASNSCNVAIVGGNAQISGWKIVDWIADANDPGVSISGSSSGGTNSSNWTSFTEKTKVDLDLIINGGLLTTGEIYAGGKTSQYKVWHSNNLTPFDGDYDSLTNKPTIPSMPTDFVSKANGGTFSGNVSIFPNASTGTFRVGRFAGQEFKLHATDTINTITSINDADENQTHNFILDREHAGTGDDNFIIQKDGTAQLTINKDADAVFAGTVQAPKFKAAQGSYNDGYQLTRSGHDTYRIALGNSEGLRIVNETDSSREELAFDGGGNATFAGTVTANGTTLTGATDISGKVSKTGDTMTGTLTVDGGGSSSVLLKTKGSARIALENANATNSFYISNTGGNGASVLDLGGALSLIENGSATFAGDVSIAGKITQTGIVDYEKYGRTYLVNVNAPLPILTHGGNALPTGGGYRVTGHISGTGTEQVAMAVFWNENGTWNINKTFEGGTSTNHVEFKLLDHGSGSVPTVTLETHTSNYNVHVYHERLSLEEGSGTDNLRGYFGSDSYLSWLESTNTLTVPGSVEVTNNLSFANGATRSIIGPTNQNLIINSKPNGTSEGLFLQINGTNRLSILKGGNATFANDLTVGGDLIINGTTTTLNTQTVEVEDNIIVLNKTEGGLGDMPTATTSGFEVYRGALTNSASFIFDDADDTWDLSHNLKVAGKLAFGTNATTDGIVNIEADGETTFFTKYKSTRGTGHTYGLKTNGTNSEVLALMDVDNNKRIAAFGPSEVSFNIAGSEKLKINSSGSATFAGNVTVPSLIATQDIYLNDGYTAANRYLLLRKNTANDGGIVMSSKAGSASATNDWQIVNPGSTRDLSFYAYGLGANALVLDRETGNATFAGDITVSKTDPTITLVDSSGANSDPSGKIIFSELSGTENFDINYNGAADRLEFRGRVDNTDNTDLVLINRDLTNTVQILGGTTISKSLTVGELTIIEPTTTDGSVLRLHNKSNGSGVSIVVSDQNQTFTSSSCQKGQLTFRHSDSQSYGSGASWHIGSDQATTSILLEGKVYYGEGIYTKPSSGTNIGTRKDTNWDSAYSKTNAFTTVGENFTKLVNVTVASYVRVNADETLSYLNAAQFLSAIGGMGSFTVGSDSGSDTVSGGQTLNLIGGTNITVEKSGDREFEINNDITNNNQLTNGEGFMKASGATMTGDLLMQDEHINFKSSGSSTLPQFFGHRSSTDLNDRAWTNEGGWAYTTFDSNSSTSNTPSTGLHNANGLLSFNTHSSTYGHQLAMTTNTNQLWFRTRNGGNFGSWAKIWKSDNDGSGSGLDADTVDGLQGASLLRSDADDTASGVITLSNTSTSATLNFSGHAGAANYNYFLKAANDGGNKAVHFVNGSTRTADGGVNTYTIRNDGGSLRLGNASHTTLLVGTGDLTYNANAVFHEGHLPTYTELGSMAYSNLTGTPTIPTNNTQLTNGAGYITTSSVGTTIGKGQNNNYIASNLPSSNSTYRDNYGEGVWAYSGYSTGSNRPYTYDATLQVMPTSNLGFELSTSWHSTGEGTLKIRALRDCCEGWGSYFDIWSSANDGAGSGLDADLLDGQQGSYYLNYNNLSNKPTIPTNNNQLTNGAGYITAAQVSGDNLGNHNATQRINIGDYDLINNTATVFYDRSSPLIDYYDYSKLVLGDSKVELHSPGEYIFSGDEPYIYFKKPSAGAFLNGNQNVMKVGLIPSFGPGLEAVDTTSSNLNTDLHFVVQKGGSQYEAIKITGKGDDTSKAQVYVKDNMTVSGKLGVGTTNPGSILAVVGQSTLNGDVILPTANRGFIKKNTYNKTGGLKLLHKTAETDMVSMRYEGASSSTFTIEQTSGNSVKGKIKFQGSQNQLLLDCTRIDIGNQKGGGTTYLNQNTTNVRANAKLKFLDSRDAGDGIHFKHSGTGKTVQMGMFGNTGDADRGSFKITQGTTEANMEANVRLEILDNGKVKLGTLSNTTIQSGSTSASELRAFSVFNANEPTAIFYNNYGHENANGNSQPSTTTSKEALRIQHGSLISNTGTNQALITFRAANTASTIRGSIRGGASGVSYFTSSDARLKEDPKDFDGLKLIGELKPYDFKWKDPVEEDRPEWYEEQGRDYGMYAQEVKGVVPNAVGGDESTGEVMQMDYSKLVPVLVKAVQEQSAQIDALQARIKVLEDN